MWEKEAPRPPLALNAERIAKIEAPQAIEFEKQQVKKRERRRPREARKKKAR